MTIDTKYKTEYKNEVPPHYMGGRWLRLWNMKRKWEADVMMCSHANDRRTCRSKRKL